MDALENSPNICSLAGRNSDSHATLELLGGARYVHVDLELDPANDAAVSGDQDWIDPIIGARVILPLAERWRLAAFEVRGDLGK